MKDIIHYIIVFSSIISTCGCRYEIPHYQLSGVVNELFGNGDFEFQKVNYLNFYNFAYWNYSEERKHCGPDPWESFFDFLG